MKFNHIALVIAGLCAASSASAQTYSVYDSFGVVGGNIVASPFSFGWTADSNFTGTLNPYNLVTSDCFGDGNVQCARLAGIDGIGVYKPGLSYSPGGTSFFEFGELNLHSGPSGQYSGIQFTTPDSDTYTISATFSGNDSQSYWHAKDYLVFADATLIGSGVFSNVPLTFTYAGAASAGTVFTLLLGPGGDGYSFDSTGLSMTITGTGIAPVPEPSAWAMMILGIAATGSALRRRRIMRATPFMIA